ncbi:hypothetical protein C1645_787776, partial [Glomus cerebriforme]
YVQTLLNVSKDFATKCIATKASQKENISTIFFLFNSICALYREKEKVPQNVKTLLQSQLL